jgi:CMP-N-acetylneuraminic acid synthetase
MRTVVLIPIKLNNQRFPGKNTKLFFDGTPLIHLIQHVCLNTKTIDEIYVYCSDEAICDYLLGGVKFLKRPGYLDDNKANSNDIIREFIKAVDANIYVETHATAPFTNSESIDDCVRQVETGEFDSAFLAKSCHEFLWQNGKPLNFDVQNFPRTQDLPVIFQEAPGAYVFLKETFEKYNRRVGLNPYIHEVDAFEAIDIDYPVDFDIANAIYKEILLNKRS